MKNHKKTVCFTRESVELVFFNMTTCVQDEVDGSHDNMSGHITILPEFAKMTMTSSNSGGGGSGSSQTTRSTPFRTGKQKTAAASADASLLLVILPRCLCGSLSERYLHQRVVHPNDLSALLQIGRPAALLTFTQT